VGDVAHANLLALDSPFVGIVNIGSGVPTTVNEIYTYLKKLTNYPYHAHHGPPKLGEVFRIYLKAERAKKELGWQATITLDEGLRRTVEYFRTHPLT